MRIVESNRLAVLADDLLQHWPQQPGPDLDTTSIVVPSLGMARWLTYRIATEFSVCAQVEFVYPATYIWSLFARVVPALAERSPFDAGSLAWRIYRLLTNDQAQPDSALSRYLESASARDRLGLSRRVASAYAEILAQRPAWAPQWQRNLLNGAEPKQHEVWLAALWRALAAEIPAAAGAHPRDEVFKRLKRDPAARAALPASMTVFAVPQMAALYQHVFMDFARYADVTIYLVNPSPEFWFDQESRAQQARRRDSAQAAFDFGQRDQRLLAALGRQTRENLSAWGVADADRQDSATSIDELFIEPAGTSLLARLQREVYAASASDRPEVLDSYDKSIQIHVCHSLARQLEVLHDQLLEVFDVSQDGAAPYAPGEVLVLVPDLDQAAATIDAVFGSALGGVNIPYVISGRAANQESPLIGAFFTLLALPAGRYLVSDIAELLELPALALRFDIGTLDLERILGWLRATGVHWGLDAATRRQLQLPEEGRHTFAEGLAELFTGYASAASQPVVIEGVMPYQDLEGKDALALGALARVMASIAALKDRLLAPRSPHQWIAVFSAVLDDFFVRRADPLFELSRLDGAMASIGATIDATAFNDAIPLNVMVDALRHALADNAPGAVPTGSVTFCAFGPLRQLPYRMICMLDLNGDGRFPRNPQRPEFDLLARQHQIGDRNLIDEDRGAFLDAVCAAGERLQCYYSGRSMRDNAPLPPSSTLDELIDTLLGLVSGAAAALRAQVLDDHPLQPFSRRYFDAAAGGRLFSYARELVVGASGERQLRPDFFTEPLAAPGAEYFEVDWHMLARVLHDPVTALLKERLGLDSYQEDRVLQDDEPEKIAPLDLKRLRERLFTLHQAGCSSLQLSHIAQAFPEAPAGVLGEIVMTPQIDATLKFAGIVSDARPVQLKSESFVLSRGAFQLSGKLDGLHPGGRFDAYLGPLKSRELLRAWLAHLLLHVLPGDAGVQAPSSELIGADQIAWFKPVENAGHLLDDLLALYWQCLCQPVALIPDISSKFASGKADAGARNTARKSWSQAIPGRSFVRAAQRQYRTAYGAILADLPPDFESVSMRVFGPMWQHLKLTKAPEIVELDDDEDAEVSDPPVAKDDE
jgi:exodeoxyribonuclease V gamma subunit